MAIDHAHGRIPQISLAAEAHRGNHPGHVHGRDQSSRFLGSTKEVINLLELDFEAFQTIQTGKEVRMDWRIDWMTINVAR